MADTTEQEQPEQPRRGPGRRFVKGRSGNPDGRPPGIDNHRTRSAEALLEGEAEALIRKTIDLALDGDARALRLCIDRLIAPRRRAVPLPLPPIKRVAEIDALVAAITAALTDGTITASKATQLGKLAEIFIRVIETTKSSRRFELP